MSGKGLSSVVGDVTEVVGEITVMVGRLAEVVGRLAEVVGVIINVVDETAEVVGKVANVVGKVLKGWSTSWCSSTVVPIFPQRHALARQGDRNVGKTPLVIGAMLGIMQFLNGHIDNVAKNF